MSALNLIIEPPAGTRKRASKADKNVLDAMVGQISESAWVTDGQTYATSKEAGQAAGIYRRALPSALDLPKHVLVSKVWGTDKAGKILADRDAKGTWRFAYTLDKTRSPRAPRKTKTNAS